MGGVIRQEDLPAAKTYSFADFERQGRDLIARARRQAEQMVADAQDKIRAAAEARQREGYEQGLAEGRQVGLEQIRIEAQQAAIEAARSELTQLLEALRGGLAGFERQKRSLIALAESGLIELAVAVARRVCKVCVQTSSEPARANARALLEMIRHHHDLELRVHPNERELLQDVAAEFAGAVGELAHVSIVADPSVDRGGCVLRTQDGTLDASIAGQLDRIAEAICGQALPHAGEADPPAGEASS